MSDDVDQATEDVGRNFLQKKINFSRSEFHRSKFLFWNIIAQESIFYTSRGSIT